MRPLSLFFSATVAASLILSLTPPARACDGDDCGGDDDHDRDRGRDDHDSHTAPHDETRAAKPNGTVDVHLLQGHVRVSGWAQNFVRVRGNLEDDCKVDVESSGDRTDIGVRCMHGPPEGNLDVQIPQGSAVDANGMSVDVEVHDVNGPLHLHTVTGDIRVGGGAPSEVHAGTTSGSIDIASNAARVEARAVSGDLKVTGVHGHVQMHSVSGACELSGTKFDDVTVETISGDVGVDGALSSDARVDVRSHSGSVNVHVPNATNADVELRSHTGELSVDVAGKRTTSSGEPPRETTLTARLGNGGARVIVHSFSGDVTVQGK